MLFSSQYYPRHNGQQRLARAGWSLLLVIAILSACLAQRAGIVHYGCNQVSSTQSSGQDLLDSTDPLSESKDCQASEQLLRQVQGSFDLLDFPVLFSIILALIISQVLLSKDLHFLLRQPRWPLYRQRLHLRFCKFQE